MLKGFRTPAENDTTSEPHWRKCHAGCARYRVNEWLCFSKQPGWNRGIQFICIPPLFLQGVGFFIYLPQGFSLRRSCQRKLTDEVGGTPLRQLPRLCEHKPLHNTSSVSPLASHLPLKGKAT